ncbi:MAG: YceI family protein [Candidatus Pacebacteria bacterium]|nr:YceI family protein [Candidatus Paceibacterota bacterium]MCD8508360.1 YceI family protein [Candidatus Paceibacterota bacterium]MCD8528373.1 YceI family protein [Candidatus Paceibacterota bacterium]MCD8563672.1 YceI family protein [Candidatus Paceibacterota bacterium]
MQSSTQWTFILIGLIVGVLILTAVISRTTQNREEVSDTPTEMSSEINQEDFDVSIQTILESGAPLDISASTISWTAQKQLVRTWIDTGTLALTSGALLMTGDAMLTGGAFVVDMSSLAVNATGMGRGNDQLRNHLLSADFFDSENYPRATFIITGVSFDERTEEGIDITRPMITGDMTIKGITQEITFPAMRSEDGGSTVFTADIVIDRSLFDIRFGSPSFFSNLGDNAIDDTFELRVRMVLAQ